MLSREDYNDSEKSVSTTLSMNPDKDRQTINFNSYLKKGSKKQFQIGELEIVFFKGIILYSVIL